MAEKKPSLSFTPQAQRLIDTLSDLGRATSALHNAEEPPTDAQIGREIFSRTITARSKSGAVLFEPLLLTTFSAKEIFHYAEAIASEGGSVQPCITAWIIDPLAIQVLSTFTYLQLPSYSTFRLRGKSPSFSDKRPAIRKRLQKGLENLSPDLEKLVGGKKTWARTIATTASSRQVALSVLPSDDQKLLGAS